MEMEEESLCLKINGEEDFYENIEAPKFVDLNAPDHYHPGDDRYWFCLRAGCDQKHEEEMDSEAIYKKFVLRVMTARSPNIRLRKALYRKDSGANIKCPQTVPAKSSKPRGSRLALISSISKRMVDPKMETKPLAKKNATPNVREKQSSVVSKALTTPRNKKRLSNPGAFRSVRNPKAMDIANSRVVAKALFHSPKKSVSTKTPLELDTTIKKICGAGTTKFEVADGKKHANTPLPSNALRKQPPGREVKSRVYDGLLSQSCKGKHFKQCHGPMPQKGAGNNLSDIEIHEKSRNTSQGVCSTAQCDEGSNAHEGPLTTATIKTSMVENKAEALSGANENTQSNYEERGSGENDVPKLLASSEEGHVASERHGEEVKMNLNLDKGTHGIMESNDGKHVSISDDKENDSEAMESDNKENASASDDNRDMELDIGHLKRRTPGKHESVKSTQMITKAMRKPSKENFVTDATGVRGLKHGKPKPTNPKPFRLRTDERGILKEATLEKKLHAAPLKEIMSVTRFPGGSLQKKPNALLRNDKSLEQTELANDAQKACEKERNTTQKKQHQNHSSSLKNSKERVRRELSSAPQRHTVSSQQKLVSPLKKYSQGKTTGQNSGNTLKRVKPHV
ncbi:NEUROFILAMENT HEAVY PROTEIN [Salix koriyanagi]|uniref:NEUROFILAMENT HEAVY PROTEIN n=1 Tax=Salix koriyanagi TaxID=2511006 RepID=A0A9Q0TRC8_9ROSI|nr:NEUROFILAMENT HEAVY PROTEIN [Salix koriyanagi]